MSVEVEMISQKLRALRRAPLSARVPTADTSVEDTLLSLALGLPEDADVETWLSSDPRASVLANQVNDRMRSRLHQSADQARTAGWPIPDAAPDNPRQDDVVRALLYAISNALPTFADALGPPTRALRPRGRTKLWGGAVLIVDEVVLRTGGFTVSAELLIKSRGSAADTPRPTPMWKGFTAVDDNLGNSYVPHPTRGSAERRWRSWRLPLYTLFLPAVAPEAKALSFHADPSGVVWEDGHGSIGESVHQAGSQAATGCWQMQL